MWLLGSPVHATLLLAGTAGAVLVYAVDRNFGSRPEDEVNLRHSGKGSGGESSVVPLNFLMLPILLGPFPLRVWAAGAAAGALGLWYALPTAWSLKRLLGPARSPFIALVWGVGVVALPALSMSAAQAPGAVHAYGGGTPTPWLLVLLLAAYRTLWLLPNVLSAEYVDRPGDIHAGNPGLTASWTRKRLYGVNVVTGTVALTAGVGVVMALSATGAAGPTGAAAPAGLTAAALWLVLDLAGLVAQIFLTRPQSALTRRRVFHLDVIAAWPVVPAFLIWA